MIDAHVHLEKGNYSVEWINQFVAYAVKRNIDEVYFLEHTHIFKECRNLYNEMSVYNEYQKNWYQKKWEQARPLKDYIDFIKKLKQIAFPIRLHIYLQLAKALCLNDMYIEESSGLVINYGDKQLGMNADMLECMVRCNVPILTASDAHSPQNVGLYIKEMNELIQSV